MQDYGAGVFEGAFTKSALKKAIKQGRVEVNDSLASTATYIHEGDRISLFPEVIISQSKQLVFPLKVLFEDEYLAVIHKPAGILVSGNGFKTIARALTQNLQESQLSDATKPQPIHRLDYATTGTLLVGKASRSIRLLNKLFEEHKIKKTYYAVAIGEMRMQGKINSEIEGKDSRSSYQVLDTVTSERFGKLNLLQLNLETGRRHQLRKHLSSIGHPILGDQAYGIDGLILKRKGLYLHAFSLAFEHPFTQEKLHVSDELPPKFGSMFNLNP